MRSIRDRFPDKLFVKVDEGDMEREVGERVFLAEDDLDKLGEVGENVEVAVYELNHCGILTTKPELHIKG